MNQLNILIFMYFLRDIMCTLYNYKFYMEDLLFGKLSGLSKIPVKRLFIHYNIIIYKMSAVPTNCVKCMWGQSAVQVPVKV